MTGRPYEKLKFYQNICEIRKMIYAETEKFPRSYIRLISQIRDAARSAKQNIREGYCKDTLGEFIHGIKISRGSLEELAGDWDDCYEDGIIKRQIYQDVKSLFQQTGYPVDRYIDAVLKLDKKGLWKTRFRKQPLLTK
jgi:four helix bundle protein